MVKGGGRGVMVNGEGERESKMWGCRGGRDEWVEEEMD